MITTTKKVLVSNIKENTSKLFSYLKYRRQRKQKTLLQLALMSGSVKRIK